jgi:hypothetical protein
MIVMKRIEIHTKVCAYLAEILYTLFEWLAQIEEHLFLTQ